MKTELKCITPVDLVSLYAELRRVFPDAPVDMNRDPSSWHGGVYLALKQGAWVDETWGWETRSDCPENEKTYHAALRPCSLGGRFFHDVRSIGD